MPPGFEPTRAYTRAAKQSGYSLAGAPEDATNAIIEAVADDVCRDVVRGTQLKQ